MKYSAVIKKENRKKYDDKAVKRIKLILDSDLTDLAFGNLPHQDWLKHEICAIYVLGISRGLCSQLDDEYTMERFNDDLENIFSDIDLPKIAKMYKEI